MRENYGLVVNIWHHKFIKNWRRIYKKMGVHHRASVREAK